MLRNVELATWFEPTLLFAIHIDELPSPLLTSSSLFKMDDEKRQMDDWVNSRKNRLPSFTEVLSRRTRPPVDLFMF